MYIALRKQLGMRLSLFCVQRKHLACSTFAFRLFPIMLAPQSYWLFWKLCLHISCIPRSSPKTQTWYSLRNYKQTTKNTVSVNCVQHSYNSVAATSPISSRENPGTLLNSLTILLTHNGTFSMYHFWQYIIVTSRTVVVLTPQMLQLPLVHKTKVFVTFNRREKYIPWP